jgi:hypothetical protein
MAAKKTKVRSGAVWTTDDYARHGYAPQFGVRFKTQDPYDALEELARIAGKSRTEVLADLVMREHKRKVKA